MKSLIFYLVASSAALQIPIIPSEQQSILGHDAEKYLIELGPEERLWVTEDEKWALRREGRRFMDVTDDLAHLSYSARGHSQIVVKFPSVPKHNESISPLLSKLDKSYMYKNLEHFSSFHTRYYKSDYGKESQAWLFHQIESIVKDSGAAKNGATVQSFPHPWGQNSIIATIPGNTENTIVVGAHQDSINLFLPSLLAAPGADDDGSGTVTILEALRVLLKSEEIFTGNATNTIEFHWYSAEEGGLLGSQAVFQEYQRQGRKVKAMLQQDMTGYTEGTTAAGKPESVGIITDFVDPGLTEFMKDIVTTYCDIPYVLTKCGYACSDHASARKVGYPSAFVIESDFEHSNHNIHTTRDTIDRLDFNHMLQHARLTLSAVFELAFAEF